MSSLVFCLTLRLHLNLICLVFVDSETPSDWLWPWVSPTVSRLSFSLSIFTHTHTHILWYISWYGQNRYRPEFRLKRLLVPVPVTQSLQIPVYEPVCITAQYGVDFFEKNRNDSLTFYPFLCEAQGNTALGYSQGNFLFLQEFSLGHG